MFLFVNSPTAHVRLRYIHMNPKQLDEDGIVSGKRVAEGETIGKVGNYNDYERGTTYHLHFDMQVPTELGYVFVNPYMTLVSAYERLIGGARHRDQGRGAPGSAAAGASTATSRDRRSMPSTPCRRNGAAVRHAAAAGTPAASHRRQPRASLAPRTKTPALHRLSERSRTVQDAPCPEIRHRSTRA